MNAHAAAIRDEFINALTDVLDHRYRSAPPQLRSRLLDARAAAKVTLTPREYWAAVDRANRLRPGRS
jgi:hypothetical protein